MLLYWRILKDTEGYWRILDLWALWVFILANLSSKYGLTSTAWHHSFVVSEWVITCSNWLDFRPLFKQVFKLNIISPAYLCRWVWQTSSCEVFPASTWLFLLVSSNPPKWNLQLWFSTGSIHVGFGYRGRLNNQGTGLLQYLFNIVSPQLLLMLPFIDIYCGIAPNDGTSIPSSYSTPQPWAPQPPGVDCAA